jgi:hypothetical protein
MPERAIESPPRLLPLLLRAGADAIPGLPRLPAGGASEGDPFETTLVLAAQAPDRDRLARYDRVCALNVSDALPLTYPHVLAFGLQMTLLAHPAFPLPAAGLVHIANRIERRRRIDAGESLELRVWLEPIEPHPRGRSVTIATEARADGETVWSEWSTMLHRGEPAPGATATPTAPPGLATAPPGPPPTAPPGPPPTAELPATARWRLPGDLGRRYAAVSGDRNPIHLHPLTAKAFGFPRPLAHGMWTIARCVAALGPELDDAVTVQVAFRRPLLLPAVVSFAEAEAGDGALAFGVRDAADGTPHLDGLARQARPDAVKTAN